MKKLLKDPLLHFLLIGAALFLVFEIIKGPGGDQESRIVIRWVRESSITLSIGMCILRRLLRCVTITGLY